MGRWCDRSQRATCDSRTGGRPRGLNRRRLARGMARSPAQPEPAHRVDAPGAGHVRATRPERGRSCQGGIARPGTRGCVRGRRDAGCWFENFSRRGGDAGKARNRFPLECRHSYRPWSNSLRAQRTDTVCTMLHEFPSKNRLVDPSVKDRPAAESCARRWEFPHDAIVCCDRRRGKDWE